MDREKVLKEAFIPKELWKEYIVLEDGTIFTSKENYDKWKTNKDNPIIKEPTELDILKKQLLETQSIVTDLQYKSLLGKEGI